MSGRVKVYIAASFSRRLEIKKYAAELEQLGFEVTSRWLDQHHKEDPTEEDWHRFAVEDLEDVKRADMLFAFTDAVPKPGGGRHAEFGVAMALGKPIVQIGPDEHVFHKHYAIVKYRSLLEFSFLFLNTRATPRRVYESLRRRFDDYGLAQPGGYTPSATVQRPSQGGRGRGGSPCTLCRTGG